MEPGGRGAIGPSPNKITLQGVKSQLFFTPITEASYQEPAHLYSLWRGL
jgi:hypothetical protein